MTPAAGCVMVPGCPAAGWDRCVCLRTVRPEQVRMQALFFYFDWEVFLMAWLELLIAGGMEVFWSTFMKLSEGFTRPLYTVLTIGGMIVSFLFLAQATRVLPLGTAYAVWTGIGAVGAVIVGIVVFKEPVTALRMVFVVLLLTGIVGLKATSGH